MILKSVYISKVLIAMDFMGTLATTTCRISLMLKEFNPFSGNDG
jgi:hypothetical protein